MSYILGVLEFIKAFTFLYKEIKSLLDCIDERKAAEKKERLHDALTQLEKAKTSEEKKNAISAIANNSF